MSYYRTPEHRKLRSELIRKWKPWEQSTGQRSDEGKAASAANSIKHGLRSKSRLDELNELKRYLREWLDE